MTQPESLYGPAANGDLENLPGLVMVSAHEMSHVATIQALEDKRLHIKNSTRFMTPEDFIANSQNFSERTIRGAILNAKSRQAHAPSNGRFYFMNQSNDVLIVKIEGETVSVRECYNSNEVNSQIAERLIRIRRVETGEFKAVEPFFQYRSTPRPRSLFRSELFTKEELGRIYKLFEDGQKSRYPQPAIKYYVNGEDSYLIIDNSGPAIRVSEASPEREENPDIIMRQTVLKTDKSLAAESNNALSIYGSKQSLFLEEDDFRIKHPELEREMDLAKAKVIVKHEATKHPKERYSSAISPSITHKTASGDLIYATYQNGEFRFKYVKIEKL